MLSSTSSSSERIPDGNWAIVLVAAMVIVLVAAAAWELFVRAGGADDIPVSDTVELWQEQRMRASALGEHGLVLVGGSRMQMGVDLGVLAEHTGLQPVMLAMSASPFMPVLEDLADDPSITGTVVVSFHSGNFMLSTRDSKSELWVGANRQRREARTEVFYQPFENSLREMLDASLRSFALRVRPQQLFVGRAGDGYLRMLPSRSQQADYSKTDTGRAYERRMELLMGGSEPRQADAADFEKRLAHLRSLVATIEARGGDVVFVRFPSTRGVLDIDNIRYPRALFWDRLGEGVGGRKIHFADYPELAGFELPDGVHLDVRDQPAFTRALAALLTARP